jgi:predicted acetyltransferase
MKYEYLKYPCVKENIASCKIAESLGGVVDHEYTEKNGSGEEQLLVEYHIYS